jgi:hypothetical protein
MACGVSSVVKQWRKRFRRARRTLFDAWHETQQARAEFYKGFLEQERDRMSLATITRDLSEQAVRESIVTVLGSEMEKIRADVRAELMAECRQEALAVARQELEEDLRYARMRYEENLAKHDAEIEQTVDLMVEKRESIIRSEIKSEYEERLENLKEMLNEANVRLVDASEALAEIVLQAFECNGPGKRVFPARRLTIKALDLAKLNRCLAYFRARVDSEYIEGSELTVACNLNGDSFQAKPRTAFRLVRDSVGDSGQPQGEAVS